MSEPPKEGETWTNIYNGRVYRWSEALGKWIFTGETVPVPFLGEFP